MEAEKQQANCNSLDPRVDSNKTTSLQILSDIYRDLHQVSTTGILLAKTEYGSIKSDEISNIPSHQCWLRLFPNILQLCIGSRSVKNKIATPGIDEIQTIIGTSISLCLFNVLIVLERARLVADPRAYHEMSRM